MDRDDLKSILLSAGVSLWTLIETAIGVAAAEHGPELRARRDGLVERLYAAAPPPDLAEPEGARSSGGSPFGKAFRSGSPATPQSGEEEEDKEVEIEEDYSLYREKKMLLSIKDSLEEPNQSDEEIFRLLQELVFTDVTGKALQQTGIGRYVYKMRKHRSTEVRVLVKTLVSKWKKVVDEWVKIKLENFSPPANITDRDSPRQIAQWRSNHNGHQACDFSYSPNPHNGRLSSEEPNGKALVERESPAKPVSTPAKVKEEQKESLVDSGEAGIGEEASPGELPRSS